MITRYTRTVTIASKVEVHGEEIKATTKIELPATSPMSHAPLLDHMRAMHDAIDNYNQYRLPLIIQDREYEAAITKAALDSAIASLTELRVPEIAGGGPEAEQEQRDALTTNAAIDGCIAALEAMYPKQEEAHAEQNDESAGDENADAGQEAEPNGEDTTSATPPPGYSETEPAIDDGATANQGATGNADSGNDENAENQPPQMPALP